MRAHWRQLANKIQLVLPSAHPSSQHKLHINRFSHFCTAHGTVLGPGYHVLDRGPDPPWEGAILGERAPTVKYRDFLKVSCAKTAEPIDLLFGLWLFGLWTPVSEGSTSSIVFARWRQCALMGGFIGATWRINRLSVAVMRAYDKLLSPLVLVTVHFSLFVP